MFVSNKKINAVAILSIAALSSGAVAQFGQTAFAMQLHDSIVAFERASQATILRVQDMQLNDDQSGLFLQLDQGSVGSAISFDLVPQLDHSITFGTPHFHNIGDNRFPAPKSDSLTVAPLPPAAFAGFGVIAGIIGVRALRKATR